MEEKEVAREIYNAAYRYTHMELEEDIIRAILEISTIRVHKKGEIIFGIDEEIISSGLVLDGMIRSYYLDAEGNEMTKNFIRKEMLFLDEGLFEVYKSICAYETLQNSVVLYMNCKKIKELINSYDQLKNFYIKCLERSMRYKMERERSFLTMSATERYLKFQKEYPELEGSVKQLHLATYIGITPESLSRILKALRVNSIEEK